MTKSRGPVWVFLGAELVALLGNAGFLVVLPWLVLSRTGSVSQMSWVTALVTIPTALATLAGGWAIDRFGQKRSSIIAGTGCVLAAAGFVLASRAGVLSLPVVIVLGAVAQLFVPLATTARDALMGAVADASHTGLERLAGTRQVVFSLAYAGGPALTGLLLRRVEPLAVVGGIGGLWLAAVVLTGSLPPAVSHPAGGATPSASSSDGASSLRVQLGRRAVWAAVVVGFGTSVITQPMTGVILPAHFRQAGQPDQYGYAVACFALGALIGAIGYAGVGAKAGRRGFIAAVLVATAGMGVFACLPDFRLLATGLALGGLGSGLLAPTLMVAITTNTAPQERGTVLGVYNAASLGAAPVGLGLLSLLMLRHPSLHTGAVAIFTVWALVALYALIRSRALCTKPLQPSSSTEAGDL